MDVSTEWLSEMEMEDPLLLYQCQMDFLHDAIPQFFPNLSPQTSKLNFPSVFSTSSLNNSEDSDSNISHPAIEKPAKQQKTNHWNLNTMSQKLAPKSSPSPFSNIISFRNHSAKTERPNKFIGNIINSSAKRKEETVSPTDMNFTYDYGSVELAEEGQRANIARSPIQAKDHVIAERKRREKLNQSFISLSALLPGLTKLDKASILGVAIEHIKELQEHVRVLEEDKIKETPCVAKSCGSSDDETSSSVDNYFEDKIFAKQGVEVEVRVCDNDVLLRVNCERQNGIIGKLFSEIEKSNMVVINSNAIPLDNASIAITIIAQMDSQFSTSAKDLGNNLRSALCN